MICKSCKSEFEPLYRNGIIISKFCIPCLSKKGKEKQDKDWKKEKAIIREKIKTKSDYMRELQRTFNKYIRLRDKGKPCISCGRPLREKYDAGHCFSVGAYPNLRFNEDNVHGQCVACNQHKHGNVTEYTINLPKRIGYERYGALLDKRKDPKNYSVWDVQEMINVYKEKINVIESKRTND